MDMGAKTKTEKRIFPGLEMSGKSAVSRRRRRKGVALILALLFVVLLSVIVVEFLYESEVEASFAENQGGELEAYLAAKSAVANGIALLAGDLLDSQMNGEPEYDSEMDLSQWAMGQPFEPLNEGFMRTTLSDEYGKINLNALLEPSQGGEPQEREELVTAVREFFAMRDSGEGASPEAIVDALLDWLDYNDNDDERSEGAESDYYMGLENPYTCKNGPMDSIEELLLVKGITSKVYFGDPEKEQLPLSEYFTVQGDWQGRVNVNTAREEVLAAMIAGSTGQPADTGLAQRIYEDARMQPFTDVSQLDQYGINQAKDNTKQNLQFMVRSNVFRIYGDGMMGQVMVRIEAYVWRTPLDLSDWQNGLGEPPKEPFRILDWRVIR